jgi:hypothetical protein
MIIRSSGGNRDSAQAAHVAGIEPVEHCADMRIALCTAVTPERMRAMAEAMIAKAERAAEAWRQLPDATVREIAEMDGCSKSLAAEAKSLALSTLLCPVPDDEQVDNWTDQLDKSRSPVRPVSRAPIGGASTEWTGQASPGGLSIGQRMNAKPSPS